MPRLSYAAPTSVPDAIKLLTGASGLAKIAYRLVQPLVITNLLYTNLAGGEYRMKIITTPNLTNVVQYRTNFTSTNWVSVLTNTAASGSFLYTNSSLSGVTNRFYRAFNRF